MTGAAMSGLDGGALAHRQRAMVALWERHLAGEFATNSVPDTMDTMTEHPVNINVPLLTGGVGYREVQGFYTDYFIAKNPPDIQITLLSRTVGSDQIVDEMIVSFTHSVAMAWMLPGVAPTGRPVQVPLVAVVQFQDGLIASEHVYWDQASVLVQVGLLERAGLPVVGGESARKLLDPAALPSNHLIPRTQQP